VDSFAAGSVTSHSFHRLWRIELTGVDTDAEATDNETLSMALHIGDADVSHLATHNKH